MRAGQDAPHNTRYSGRGEGGAAAALWCPGRGHQHINQHGKYIKKKVYKKIVKKKDTPKELHLTDIVISAAVKCRKLRLVHTVIKHLKMHKYTMQKMAVKIHL